MHLRPPPWIVGHRGAAGEAPENTLPSLLLAARQGADLVELDLQLSSDGELVACHDWDLTRLAGHPLVVEESTRAELAAVPIGDAAAGEPAPRIPTLAEVLAAAPADLPLNLELKRERAAREDLVAALGRQLGDRRQVLISSFDWALLDLVRRALPHLPVAPLARSGPEALVAAAERLAAWSLHCHRRIAGPRLLAAARQARRPVLVYTVNDAAEARRLLARGASGLFTDFPGRLRAALAEVE